MPHTKYAPRTTRLAVEIVPATDARSGVISIDMERRSGAPCFAGTRVPIQDLWDYLSSGGNIDEFLDSFPTVSRDHAIRIFQLASAQLLDGLPVG